MTHSVPAACSTHLPLVQLAGELHLLLDGLEQLGVDLHHVNPRPRQVDLSGVLPSHRLVPHLPSLRDDQRSTEVIVGEQGSAKFMKDQQMSLVTVFMFVGTNAIELTK